MISLWLAAAIIGLLCTPMVINGRGDISLDFELTHLFLFWIPVLLIPLGGATVVLLSNSNLRKAGGALSALALIFVAVYWGFVIDADPGVETIFQDVVLFALGMWFPLVLFAAASIIFITKMQGHTGSRIALLLILTGLLVLVAWLVIIDPSETQLDLAVVSGSMALFYFTFVCLAGGVFCYTYGEDRSRDIGRNFMVAGVVPFGFGFLAMFVWQFELVWIAFSSTIGFMVGAVLALVLFMLTVIRSEEEDVSAFSFEEFDVEEEE